MGDMLASLLGAGAVGAGIYVGNVYLLKSTLPGGVMDPLILVPVAVFAGESIILSLPVVGDFLRQGDEMVADATGGLLSPTCVLAGVAHMLIGAGLLKSPAGIPSELMSRPMWHLRRLGIGLAGCTVGSMVWAQTGAKYLV